MFCLINLWNSGTLKESQSNWANIEFFEGLATETKLTLYYMTEVLRKKIREAHYMHAFYVLKI